MYDAIMLALLLLASGSIGPRESVTPPVTPPAASPGSGLGVLRVGKGLRPTVEICHGRACRLLHRFTRPTSVTLTQQSPDGRHALVWYHPDRRVRRLAIFEVSTGKRLADIQPGFGGLFHFLPQGRILHSWGCGTQCANLRIYDLGGRVVWSTFSNGLIHSPSRRYVVIFPSHLSTVSPPMVYDLHIPRPRVAYQLPRAHIDGLRFTPQGLEYSIVQGGAPPKRHQIPLPGP